MIFSTCTYRSILEPCGLKNINYQIDPYIGCEHNCHYCYALKKAETDWKYEILVHRNITEQLEKELKDIQSQNIYLGYHTDPYQPCEEELIQTRKVIDLLLEKDFSASILTKSDLVLRDKYLLRDMKNASVSISVTFTNNRNRKLFEHNTIDTEKRINALKELKQLGIKTNALICPVIPYITNVKELIHMLQPYTDTIWIYGLSILNKSDLDWLNVESILGEYYNGSKQKIENAIFSKDHEYWNILKEDLLKIQNYSDSEIILKI